MTEDNETNAGTGEQLLLATFQLGDASFAFDTVEVQEVLRVSNITTVHHAPDYVLGAMNMRGRIATVIDLGTKLELPPVEITSESRIFMVEWKDEHVGLLVDRMSDVLSVDRSELKPVPENVHGIQSRQVRGVCHAGGNLVALLDLAEVLRLENKADMVAGRTVA